MIASYQDINKEQTLADLTLYLSALDKGIVCGPYRMAG